MDRFGNVSMKKKLAIGFAIVVLLLLGITVTAYFGLSEIQHSERQLFEVNFKSAIAAAELEANINSQRAIAGVMLEIKPAEWGNWQRELDEQIKAQEEIIGKILAASASDPDIGAKVGEYSTLAKDYRITRKELLSLFAAGREEKARALHLGVQFERYQKLRSIARGLAQSEIAKAEENLQRSVVRTSTYLGVFLLMGGLGIFSALFLGFFMNRTVNGYIVERRTLEGGLQERSAYTRSLIEASLDPLVTISPEGKITDVNRATEEVTGVARDRLVGSDFSSYFTEPERARQGYRQVLAEGMVRDYPLILKHVSGSVADVLYNAAVFRDEAGAVKGVFAAARDVTERRLLERKVQERSARLEKVLQEAQEAVGVLAQSSSEILSVISGLASGANEAATAVSETTSTVEEVRQTAQLSNQKAKDIAKAGQNAAEALVSGQKNVEEAVLEMNRIREQMDSIGETIMKLSEQSQAIGEITGTVSELAEQSNLLAVNAAIEAAKAGEQGKGFAVVAQEIRSLAEQSKQATSQVRSLLSDIQRAIGNAVMATEQAAKVVESGVAQSHQAGESIQHAVEATTGLANASTQIAASSQQQMIGVDQVATAMENINLASSQNAQGAKQVERVAQNLHELSQKLKVLVEEKNAGS